MRNSQVARVGQWSAVVMVLVLCVVLGGCYRARNQRLLALSERSVVVLERDLAMARQEQQRPREGWVLYTLGIVSQEQGQLQQALAHYEQALTIAQEVKAPSLEAAILSNLGNVYADLGQSERAAAVWERDLVLARERQDQEREGWVLLGLGESYQRLGQSERATALYEEALALARKRQHRLGEGWALARLGYASSPEQAVGLLDQALAIARELKHRYLEAVVFWSMGAVYERLHQPERAIALLEQALTMYKELKHRAGEAGVLQELGGVYGDVHQQPEQALALYEQALIITREVPDRMQEGEVLHAMGSVYYGLGQREQALALYQQALAIAREGKARAHEAGVLNSLGNVYGGLGQREQALALYEQALALAQEVKSRFMQAVVLMNLGNIYKNLEQPAQALALYEQTLALAQAVKRRFLEAAAFLSLGIVYQKLEQPERALPFYEQGLTMAQELKHRSLEAGALAALMEIWKARAQPQLAIFYGKLAVNVIQTLRIDLRNLVPELQQGFLLNWEGAYRRLAEILISEGRLPEAHQVLALLKEHEFFDFVRRDATVGDLSGQAALTPSEAAWAARYRAIAERLAALATEYGDLRHRQTHTAADTQRMEALEADLRVARQALEQFLTHLQSEARQAPQVQERIARLAEESQGLMDALHDLGPGTVALYTLVTDTAYRVILTTPEVQLARETPIATADLARKIHAFREALDPARPGGLRRDPRPLAHELYQLLVAPIAQDLQQAQAQTLMWSLDGVLRYLPLAALHDGEQYLLERYRLALFTPASATRLEDLPRPQWQGLGFGVSKAHAGFPALPTVPDELRGIIRDPAPPPSAGVLPGLIHLDAAFTTETLRAALRQRYPVVHIASHFQLHPGDDTASFLLLGDGSHLPLAQLKTWPQPFQGVELLTLSACNTAVGSTEAAGKEVEGFAVLAQRQGAKAVVATLWPVVDMSTAALMETFYRLREHQPGLPKVEALRQAQLTLLRGTPQEVTTAMETRALVQGEAASNKVGGDLPFFVSDPRAPYAHPAYWAPFVLIGNWR